MMPGMDGWSVLSALKADIELAAIPVVMVSIVQDRNLGFALGAVEYLTKPVDRQQLVGVLKKVGRGPDHRAALIVEDDPATREILRRTLEGEGWEVREAENGQLGLDQVAEAAPDLILLDLMMPVMDGFTFVHKLRKRPAWRNIPVVVVTAKTLTDEDYLELNGFVEKVIQKDGYAREQLLQEVRELFSHCGVGRAGSAP
jgi:CheY-like chemotaxis protein